METQDIFSDTAHIFSNRKILNPSYNPDKIICRDDEIKELGKNISPALYGDSPNNVFIYGNTGAGKTVTTQYVLRQAQEKTDNEFVSINIDCSQYSSGYEILIEIGRILQEAVDIDVSQPKNGLSRQDLYSIVDKELSEIESPIVFLFDDIDKIDAEEIEDLLYKLSRIEKTITQLNSGIIITSIDGDYLDGFSEDVLSALSPRNMYFSSYSKSDIEKILSHRFKKGFADGISFPKGSMKLCAGITYNRREGDLRYGIELLRECGDILSLENQTTISEDIVHRADQNIRQNRIETAIRQLSHKSKQLVHIIYELQKQKGEQIPTRDIYEKYNEKKAKNGLGSDSYRRVQEVLQKTENTGVIESNHVYNGKAGGNYKVFVVPEKVQQIIEENDNILSDIADTTEQKL